VGSGSARTGQQFGVGRHPRQVDVRGAAEVAPLRGIGGPQDHDRPGTGRQLRETARDRRERGRVAGQRLRLVDVTGRVKANLDAPSGVAPARAGELWKETHLRPQGLASESG